MKPLRPALCRALLLQTSCVFSWKFERAAVLRVLIRLFPAAARFLRFVSRRQGACLPSSFRREASPAGGNTSTKPVAIPAPSVEEFATYM